MGPRRSVARCSAPLVLLVLLVACGDSGSSKSDGRADGSGHDIGIDARAPGPWVETFVGKECTGQKTEDGVVARQELQISGVVDVAVGNDGSVYILGHGVWRVVGDEASMFAPYGSEDGRIGDPQVGGDGHSIAIATTGELYLAGTRRLRLLRDGTIKTVAGNKEITNDSHVDGPGLQARFQQISDIAAVPDGLLLADVGYVRHFDGSVVSTIAGDGKPIEGIIQAKPALQTSLGSVNSLFVSGDEVWLHSYYRLWRLQGGTLTPEAGSTPWPLSDDYKDGNAADALIGLRDTKGLVKVGARLVFSDFNYHSLRELTGGVVSTLNGDTGAMPPKAGFRDGPLQQAQFNKPRGMAVDAQGRIYVADMLNCRIRRINLD